MAFSIRTIFLFVRGIDQASRTLKAIRKEVRSLKEEEDRMAQVSYRMMFAGAAFTAFGSMAMGALYNIMGATSKGSLVMEDFARQTSRLKSAFGENLVPVFEKFLTQYSRLVNFLTRNPIGKFVLSGLARFSAFIASTLIAVGIITTASSVILKLIELLGKSVGKVVTKYSDLIKLTQVGTKAVEGTKSAIEASEAAKTAAAAGAGRAVGAGGAGGLSAFITAGLATLAGILSVAGMTGPDIAYTAMTGKVAESPFEAAGMIRSREEAIAYYNMNINIYDNQFPRDVEPEELSREMSIMIADEIKNNVNVPR